jgi:hypothetical protein
LFRELTNNSFYTGFELSRQSMSNIELIVFFTAEVFLVFVVHELGHLLTARYFGVRVLEVVPVV